MGGKFCASVLANRHVQELLVSGFRIEWKVGEVLPAYVLEKRS